MASPVVGPLVGNSDAGPGVSGTSNTNDGVAGRSTSAFGVFGASATGVGMRAVSGGDGAALEAQAKGNGIGVSALSGSGIGVSGTSNSGPGVSGTSNTNDGVAGRSTSAFGVFGASVSGVGIRAVSEQDRPALEAQAKGNGIGVSALSGGGDGVFGTSVTGVGVHGKGGHLAGLFEGDIRVTGKVDCPTSTINCFDVNIVNADCAEEFELAGTGVIEPGTLMSFGSDGNLLPSSEAYDGKVAGVISGAGEYKPGIVLDKRHGGNRVPIALLGKVYCKVDAEYSAIDVGDLLTTSPTAGHAMKATDPARAFGAVIGKALRAKSDGRGMIPVLIALQ
jgi:hypothetical protein